MNCPMCHCEQLDLLGVLGNSAVLRCRACHWQFNVDADELDPELCPTCGQ